MKIEFDLCRESLYNVTGRQYFKRKLYFNCITTKQYERAYIDGK
ncbi:hypothetical protein HMPREF9089_00802 [Eubacterium brachy ATCC 33089]|nr:hypothetical protein HMPREF9089_00802 [Eubacterium brachy ATCC 33089]